MKPTMCTLLLSIFILTSLHVSGNYMPIIRITYCFYATLVFFTLCGWLSGLLVGNESHPNQHTIQPPSLIPTSTPDSHPVSSQPTDQTTCHPHLQESRNQRRKKFKKTPEDGADRLSLNVCKGLPIFPAFYP